MNALDPTTCKVCPRDTSLASATRHASPARVTVSQSDMSSTYPNPSSVPDRDNLPLKKRDQRKDMSLPPQQHHYQHQDQHQQPCDVATFKVPFPLRSYGESRQKQSAPLQPVPRRVPVLHQPWVQSSTGSRPHVSSTFSEHPGWLDWRETGLAVQLGWDFHSFPHQAGFSVAPYTLYSAHPQEPSGLSLGYQGMVAGYGWEQLKMLSDETSSMNVQQADRNRGPYARRREKKAVGASHPSPSFYLSSREDLKLPLLRQSRRSCAKGERLRSSLSSLRDDTPAVSSEQDTSSSSPPNPFPWLLPHFVAGSLIELRDGRLRKVEHLQTEDFLLGSLALPDLRLSCCTVQSITAAPASSSVSRLLVLLHGQQSQVMRDGDRSDLFSCGHYFVFSISAEIKADAYARKTQGSDIVWQRLLILEQTPVLFSIVQREKRLHLKQL